MIRRGRILTWVVVTLMGIYTSGYLFFRLNHTFRHRAGLYARDARLGAVRNTNHYIEPSPVADGPEVFGLVALGMAATGNTDFNGPEFQELSQSAATQVTARERRRERLFVVFKPAAFCETVFWKIVDPRPILRYSRSKAP